jgi:hypothetical protein
LEEALERFQTETTASMKCAAKVIDPINEERLEEAKKAEKAESSEPENKEEEAGEPETINVGDIADVEEGSELAQALTEEPEAHKKGKGKKNKK